MNRTAVRHNFGFLIIQPGPGSVLQSNHCTS
jgi:hypothetical protein